ncbi:unnamed protein product [Symbiodinium sp. CCMP2456]|nr:unnamed protein product [Symbiodinium sp. CCMP2456]
MPPPALLRGLSGEVEEVFQPKPTSFRGLVGGALQRVKGIFRRSSSSSATTEDDEEVTVEAIGECEDAAVNPESQAASLQGDFRMLPPSAWQMLHARFCEPKSEQETSEFSTAPTAAASEIPHIPHGQAADGAGLEIDMPMGTDSWPVDARSPASTEAAPSPESDWWLAFCVAVRQNLCCARVR